MVIGSAGKEVGSGDGVPRPCADVARFALAYGACDALRAVRFSRRFPPHFHETFAIGVIEAGGHQLHTPRGSWVARAGSILALSPGEIHGAEALSEAGYAYRMIYPSVELMREIGAIPHAEPEHRGPYFSAPVIDDPLVARELLGAHVPLMDGAGGGPAESQLVAGLRALVARHGARRGTGEAARVQDLEIVEKARDFLHARFAERVRLARIAEECGISPFHLIRVFRRVVGVPPYAYLVQLRVNRAQAMLCQGSSVADVAYSCGFSDQSHLTRTFKSAVGVPPGQYVRQLRPRAA